MKRKTIKIATILFVLLNLNSCLRNNGCYDESSIMYNYDHCYQQRNGSKAEIYDQNGQALTLSKLSIRSKEELNWYKVPLIVFLGLLSIGSAASDVSNTLQGQRLVPVFQGASGNISNSYIQKKDAYGPGIHMDQYGRAVKVAP